MPSSDIWCCGLEKPTPFKQKGLVLDTDTEDNLETSELQRDALRENLRLTGSVDDSSDGPAPKAKAKAATTYKHLCLGEVPKLGPPRNQRRHQQGGQERRFVDRSQGKHRTCESRGWERPIVSRRVRHTARATASMITI